MEPSVQLYKFHISLQEVKPVIWRRIVIPVKWRLDKVAWTIILAMGWTNSHLHEIEHGDSIYVPDLEECDDLNDEIIYEKYTKKRLFELGLNTGDSFNFRYDFGDGWEHKVTMEGPAEIPAHHKIPRADCLEGARACPPEDCGGPGGYEDLLKTLGDVTHPDHKQMTEWLGKPFDPEFFNLKATKDDLRTYSDCPTLITNPGF